MQIDRSELFERVRHSLFGGALRQSQMEGMGAIVDGWEARALARLPAPVVTAPAAASGTMAVRAVAADRAALAYVLATAFHETAATMQPVRETLAATDDEAILRLDHAFAAGRLASVKTPYWRRDADGRTWLGRGLVQLTHKANYAKMSEVTGIDLLADPARAMELPVAVKILLDGMLAGSFTGRRLSDHFSPGRADWTGARRIINGTDRAALVGAHGRAFYAALGG